MAFSNSPVKGGAKRSINMAYAQELKNLVAEIKTGHQDRAQDIRNIKNDAHKIQEDARQLIAQFQEELKQMAGDLKNFLAKSEADRKKDFSALLEAIQERIRAVKDRVGGIKTDTADLLVQYNKEMKELAGELKEFFAKVKEFLNKSEAERTADFKTMMQGITGDIKEIKQAVEVLRQSTGNMLADYKTERKAAAGYWASLSNKAPKEGPKESPEEIAPKPKAGQKKKSKK